MPPRRCSDSLQTSLILLHLYPLVVTAPTHSHLQSRTHIQKKELDRDGDPSKGYTTVFVPGGRRVAAPTSACICLSLSLSSSYYPTPLKLFFFFFFPFFLYVHIFSFFFSLWVRLLPLNQRKLAPCNLRRLIWDVFLPPPYILGCEYRRKRGEQKERKNRNHQVRVCLLILYT